MDSPIKSFCDQVSIHGQLNLQKCGINANNQFFYNYSVAPTAAENNRLLTEIRKHLVLSHLTSRTVVTRQDVTPFYPPAPQVGYPPQAAGYSHGFATPHAGFGGSAYPSPVSNPAPYAGFGVSTYPSAMSAPAPQTGLYPTLIPTPATGGRFSASSSAGTFSTTPGAVGGTGSAYTASPVAFTQFSSGPSVSTTPLVPSAARPFSSAVDDVKVLPGRVKLVTSSQGIEKFIERKNSEKPYGVVNSIDESGQLQRGVASAIKSIAGNNYARVIKDKQNLAKQSDRVGYGQCFTYDCNFNPWSKPSGLNNWKTIHNVLVPFSTDPKFEVHLKNTLLEVFNEAARHGIDRVILPLLGCGQAGGTGDQLAEAISAAKRAFESSGRKAPEMILVATSSTADKKASAAFESKWNSLPIATPTTFIASSGTAASSATTKAASGYNTSKVLIPGQLEVVMNSDGGMFSHARECSKKGEKFNLVNAANSYMSHGSGVAAQLSGDLGPIFDSETKQLSPVPTGECRTTGSYSYAWDKTKGLTKCENILHVVAPDKHVVTSPSQYHGLFKETFVSLLSDGATKAGGHTIVSCFIGCLAFHGNGHDMAKALYEAYRDPRVQALSKVPKLILAGWKGGDWQVYQDFVQTFDSLNSVSPVRLSSGRVPAHSSSHGISGTIFPAGGGATSKRSSAGAASVPMAGSSRLYRSDSGTHPSLFGGLDPARRSTSPEPVAPSAVSSSRYGMWDNTRSSDRNDDFLSTASRTLLKMPVHDSTVSSQLSKLALVTGKTDLTSGAGKLLSGDGTLSCLDSDDPISRNTERFIQAGIDAKVFKKVQVLPAEISSDSDVDVTSLEPYHKHKYGQLLSYTSRGQTQYISVDGVQGLLEASSNKDCFVCPKNRIVVLGTLIGNQPKGDMTVSRGPQPAAGYEGYGHIRIDYNFKGGMQTKAEGHPNPDTRYMGTSRVAYLPDNPEGNKVLGLLQRAFNQKLTFTIGRSNTTGQENVVTWNEIHHKTSLSAPAHEHGYLGDSKYLERVKEELKDRGIE